MDISGRKSKPHSEKIVAEAALYMLLSIDGAFVRDAFCREFDKSRRTCRRYLDDLMQAGFIYPIVLSGNDYTLPPSVQDSYESRYYNEYSGMSSALSSANGHGTASALRHLQRLNRICRIIDDIPFEIFDPEEAPDMPDSLYEPVCSGTSASSFKTTWKEALPEEIAAMLRPEHPEDWLSEVSLRTLQRDLLVIREAYPHFRHLSGSFFG